MIKTDQHQGRPTLKQLIAKAGISQRQLSQKLGISERTLNSWVIGQYHPTLINVLPIARELNISLKTLALSLGYDVSGIPSDKED
jgi:transcriptional regulator with XRE-family HTH domain